MEIFKGDVDTNLGEVGVDVIVKTNLGEGSTLTVGGGDEIRMLTIVDIDPDRDEGEILFEDLTLTVKIIDLGGGETVTNDANSFFVAILLWFRAR
jgi:hypothetical protein